MNQQMHRTLWSPLPTPRLVDKRHTIGPSNSGHRLKDTQVTHWPEFENLVLKKMSLLEKPPDNFTPSQPEEFFIVGNETGLQGRLIEHLAQSLGPIFGRLNLGVTLADFQVGQTIDETRAQRSGKGKQPAGKPTEEKKKNDGSRSVPDFVLLKNDEYTFCVMIEVKTFWTFERNENQTEAQFLAAKVGQLARYMDDTKCLYGILTTHHKTYFVWRTGRETFAVSNGIYAGETATSEVPSLRQYMLFFASLANREASAYAKEVSGKDLTKEPDVGIRWSKRRKVLDFTPWGHLKNQWNALDIGKPL